MSVVVVVSVESRIAIQGRVAHILLYYPWLDPVLVCTFAYTAFFVLLNLFLGPRLCSSNHNRERYMKHHFITATLLLYLPLVPALKSIYNGTGFGTYYYDVAEVDACGSDFAIQNTGPVECSFSTALSLDQINSEYLVAMNHTQLVGHLSEYCGKKIVVSVNGLQSGLPLFIGDGCQRCGNGSSSGTVWNPDGAPGLDFSYSVLSELSTNACTYGHIAISWSIVDETLFNFDTGDSYT